MKKTPLLGSAAVLLGSIFALTACNGAAVRGDYTTPSASRLHAVLSAIDEDDLFGNPREKDYSFGLSMTSEFNMDTTISGNDTNVHGYSLYDMVLERYSAAGAGEAVLTAEGDAASYDDMEIDTRVYGNNQSIYLINRTESGMLNGFESGRIGYGTAVRFCEAMMDTLLPSNPFVPDNFEGFTLSGSQLVFGDLEDSIDDFAAMGMEVGLDISDGTKIRLTAEDDFFDRIADSYDNGRLTYETTSYEIYLSVDEDGVFRQLSAMIDISYSFSVSGSYGSTDLNGYFVLERSSPTVNLPDDLNNTTKYPSSDSFFNNLI